ncbi:MAG: hypothetical protein P8Z41_15610, partial [Anaerolineales bacterium]
PAILPAKKAIHQHLSKSWSCLHVCIEAADRRDHAPVWASLPCRRMILASRQATPAVMTRWRWCERDPNAAIMAPQVRGIHYYRHPVHQSH